MRAIPLDLPDRHWLPDVLSCCAPRWGAAVHAAYALGDAAVAGGWASMLAGVLYGTCLQWPGVCWGRLGAVVVFLGVHAADWARRWMEQLLKLQAERAEQGGPEVVLLTRLSPAFPSRCSWPTASVR